MKHETSIALYAYWQSCQGRGGVPAGAIRALELAPILPSLFLVDLDFDSGVGFRFCGATIATRYGRDLTHESFLTPWTAADRDTLESTLKVVATRSVGFVAGMMAETVGAGVTAFEMLVLPLAGRGGTAGAIGSMVRVGGHEEMNRIRARLVSQSLRSVRFLPSAADGFRGAMPSAGVLANVPSEARRRYRHLTVVTGGR